MQTGVWLGIFSLLIGGALARAEAIPLSPRPLTLEVGTQALGFAPGGSGPLLSLGTERSLLRRGAYHLQGGLAGGAFHQAGFASGPFMDLQLISRVQGRGGLSGELALVGGGQAMRVPGTVYALAEGGLEAHRGAWHPSARAGLGLSVGQRLGGEGGGSSRIFLSYRQLVVFPFMPGNDVPVMGLTTLTTGISMDMPPRRRR